MADWVKSWWLRVCPHCGRVVTRDHPQSSLDNCSVHGYVARPVMIEVVRRVEDAQ